MSKCGHSFTKKDSEKRFDDLKNSETTSNEVLLCSGFIYQLHKKKSLSMQIQESLEMYSISVL